MIEFGLGHVGLNVSNADAAERFFADGLGLATLTRGEFNGSPFLFLGQDGKLLVTLWQQSTGAFSPSAPGLHHLAFQVADVTQLREVQTRLEAAGATFLYDGIVPHGETLQSSAIYFAGPDGIRLEVSAPDGGKGLAAPVAGAPPCGFF